MTGFEVQPAALKGHDARLRAAAERVRERLLAVHAFAGDVLATGWQGAAASAFEAGWAQWYAGTGAMLAALEELAGAVGAAATGYTGTDAGVRTAVTRAGA